MCGFLGEVNNTLIDRKEFDALLKLSHQRGPDKTGYWSDGNNCQLGFNRLAIMDVSENGSQPMMSPSNRFAMVFNGEVYNFRDLQHQFSIDQKNLKSSSDTEVLTHVLEQCDIENFANLLNGMFAVAIFDNDRKLLHLIRDFAGIKPLYYGLHDNGIVFASQFDQVFKHFAFINDRVLRPEVMKEYFALGYMPAPNTVFENIFQLEPGEMITYSLAERIVISRKKYYSWKKEGKYLETANQTIKQFDIIFRETIKDQLVADVPLATFLSGGIDSPLVTAVAAKEDKSLRAYTFEMENSDMNEAPFASQYAAHLKVHHSIEKLEKDKLINMVGEHFKYMPEPHGDYSSLPTYLISQKARQHATVMLSGDGGDELFWGYPRFLRQAQYARYFRYPVFLRKIMTRVIRKTTGKSITYALDDNKYFGDWTFNLQSRFNARELKTLMPYTNITHALSETYSFKGNLRNNVEVLNWLKWNEFYAHLQRVLRKVDLASMANSLEVRVPFLDKRCIEFSNEVKPELGNGHFTLKAILKKALARYIPESMMMQGKRGFSISIGELFRNELKADLIKQCIDTPFYGAEHLNVNFIQQYTSDFLAGKHTNEWGVWHFYAWQKWASIHILKIKTDNT